MSWDVLLMPVPENVSTADEIPEDFAPVIGSAEDVRKLISQVVPEVDFSDPNWGILDGSTYSIEFNLGSKEVVDTIMLHVRGDEAAIQPIGLLCHHHGWKALDFADSQFIDFENEPSRGLQQWSEYRDRVVDAEQKDGATVVNDPDLPGVRVDAVIKGGPSRTKKWWQFWK